MGSPQKHARVCEDLNRSYTDKYASYGDAFGETFRKLGMLSAVTRITDKVNKLQALTTNPEIPDDDESILDTCMNIANYAIMTVMEIKK